MKNMLLVKFEEWFEKKYGISINDIDNPLINEPSEENISEHASDEIDPEALAYIKAKQKVHLFILASLIHPLTHSFLQVSQLQKARKQEKLKN